MTNQPTSIACAKPDCTKSSKSFKTCAACGKAFHTLCGEFSTYKDKAAPNQKRFFCCVCATVPQNVQGLILQHKSRSNSNSSHASSKRKIDDLDEDSSDDDDTDDEQPDLKTILKAINKGGKATKKLASEVKNLNISLSSRCSVIESEVAVLKTQMSEMKLAHEREMNVMNSKINSLEADSKKEVYIHGHLRAGNDGFDPLTAVSKIADTLKFKLPASSIKSARVIPRKPVSPRTPVKYPPIIAVIFFSHATADQFVEAKRKHGKLTNMEVLGTKDEADNKAIAISFRLSQEQFLLLKETKARAMLHQYKYVWNSNGAVLVRRADGHRAIRVNNFNELDGLMPATQLPLSGPPNVAMQTEPSE